MAIGTVRNYLKSIKLFCDMTDVHVPLAEIARGLPRAKIYKQWWRALSLPIPSACRSKYSALVANDFYDPMFWGKENSQHSVRFCSFSFFESALEIGTVS
jgi:hypothetical protein